MQLPPDDELVLVAGYNPIRAKKAFYYEDRELRARILPPPKLSRSNIQATNDHPPSQSRADDWARVVVAASATDDPAHAGICREPELPEHEDIAPEPAKVLREFEPEDESDDDVPRLRAFQRNARAVARQVSLDPADDMGL